MGADLRLTGGRPVLDPPARSLARTDGQRGGKGAEAESSTVVRPGRPPDHDDRSQLASYTPKSRSDRGSRAMETADQQRRLPDEREVTGPITEEGVAVGGAFDSGTATGLMPIAHLVADVLESRRS